MYSKKSFMDNCNALFAQCSGNQIKIPDIGPIEFFDMPVIGFASASDALFERYKEKEVIGSAFLSPKEWLPEAKTVVAFFFPFSAAVRESNRKASGHPSVPWIYGRSEGQQFLNDFMLQLQQHLAERGIRTCVPGMDDRFGMQIEPFSGNDGDDFHVNSSWSERHTAYACGLGTFGLSRGLITEKGMAGRITSIVTDAEFEPDERTYTDIHEFCIRCGVCVMKCPADAISTEYGKNNIKCKLFLNQMEEQYSPRYGCGKCQVGVPCEFGLPAQKYCG